ncbi:MAG: hypothetical protein QOG77_99 [Solirubrobacteraceae bacterium]|nr:hypothetical protein [Solirubrobacteraceae bacterium]
MADDDLPPGADELYGLPFEDFIAERAALAKRLRGEGDREGAKRVTALRKPSVAAWTLNQLVRTRAKDVAAFTKAAEGLRSAQAALLEGRGSPAGLREAREAERGAVDKLVKVARGLFPGGHEPGGATLERVAATLHAAASDDAVREEVLSGRLLTEREPSGFGDLDVELAAAVPLKPKPRSRTPKDDDAAARKRAEAEAEAKAVAERREREQRRAELQTALEEAVEHRRRAEEALDAARAEEKRRRAALEEAG